MIIGADQYRKIVEAAFAGTPSGSADRDSYTPATLPAADAELIVAIAQLAIAADRVDDPDEQALFGALVEQLYKHAKVSTSAPTLAPVDDDEQRMEHLRSHAAQLAGKPSAALAFAIAYLLVIADLDLAPEEGDLLDTLREALGLDEDRAEDVTSAVSSVITPE